MRGIEPEGKLTQYHYTIFETAAGFCGLGWTERGIARFQLPAIDVATARRLVQKRLPADWVEAEPAGSIVTLVGDAQRYFAGTRIDFSRIAVDLDGQSDFFTSVYRVVRGLGWGQTTTYGAIARELGAGPEAARNVGQAMATNPVPLIIPCHRVLAAGGRIGGFSAPGGSDSKARMLALEGVVLAASEPMQQSLPF